MQISGRFVSERSELLALFRPDGREAGLDQVVRGEAIGLFTCGDAVKNVRREQCQVGYVLNTAL